ncbi:MAG: sensor histidine kinase [Acidobacteria bacterium]|nr:sensor histidine kinase [Acidobacteriota bacterium]
MPASRRLLASMHRPLVGVLEVLAAHKRPITASWRRRMAGLGLPAGQVELLSGLSLLTLGGCLRAGNFEGYRQAAEHRGHLLAEGGISEEHAVAALALLGECCLPYLGWNSSEARGLAAALARLTSTAQLSVISGYENQRAAGWRALEQRLRSAEERLRNFSMHLINISEQDRSRLSRDLHDEVGHNLLVLKLYMEMIAMDLKEGKSSQVVEKLEEAVELVGQAIEGVRRLAFNLGPAILDEMGFVPSLKRYARQFTARTRIRVRVEPRNMPAELPSSYQVALYRVFQGALSNIAQHAQAKNAKVTLGSAGGSISMVIEDDGIGFDVEKVMRDSNQAFGLMAMRQRIEMLGGGIRAESQPQRAGAKTGGTHIEVRLPLLEASGAA